MTREEFERIKEAEKEHLRAIRKLKQTVKSLERQKSVNDALTDLASTTGDLLDEHTALVEKLSEQTALQEARFEVAMESVEGEQSAAAQALKDEEELAKIEAARRQSRAQELVRKAKLQMGAVGADDVDGAGRDARSTDGGAERTIGRSAGDSAGNSDVGQRAVAGKTPGPAGASGASKADDPAPEKTIGRKRRQ